MTYRIVRFYRDDRPRETGLTLEQAREHCNDPQTSGDGWFDGYYPEEN